VEVKAAVTVTPSDGHGLRRLAEQCGKDYRDGVLFHSGSSTLKLNVPSGLAVPLARLWDM
jgi:hypothetical protein